MTQIVCPKCSHEQTTESDECYRCGFVIFPKRQANEREQGNAPTETV